MSTFNIMSKVENQISQLEQAKAVYGEVGHYFEQEKYTELLPYYSGHILLLLHAADTLLHSALPELNEVVAQLNEKCKKEMR